MTSRPESSTQAAASAGGVGVAVVAAGAAYEMFEVVSLSSDGRAARVRGAVLLEISEELPLRVTRAGASVDVRARVAGHERGDDGTVTQLVFLDGETELRKLLGA